METIINAPEKKKINMEQQQLNYNIKKEYNTVPKLIQMSNILISNEKLVIQADVPLKDEAISPDIKDTCENNHNNVFFQIDQFFDRLHDNLETAIITARLKAKDQFEKLTKQESQKNNSIDKLKQDNTNIESNNCIDNTRKNMNRDDILIDEDINRLELSFEQPNIIAKELIESIENLTFFESRFFDKINLIKSTIGNSQMMEISRIINHNSQQVSSLQVQNSEIEGYWNQVFIDPVINPNLKYIFHIEVELAPDNKFNQFMFGIANDSGINRSYAYFQQMCYYDCMSAYGITKSLKGSSIQSQSRKGKHSFEMRIYLNGKILRVSSLPEYTSVVELDDWKKVDTKDNYYRVFLSMYCKEDIMRITKAQIVKEFNEDM